jgi:uncharacterized peroxidase-related enzyme
MSQYPVHTAETAPDGARRALETAHKSFGFVPNLIGMLAEAPAAAEAYLALGKIFAGSSLSPVEQQVVLLSTSFTNRCSYCMAAHSAIAEMQGVEPGTVAALRDGRPLADPRLEALRSFTARVVEARGWVDDEALEAFLAAGFSRSQSREVVLGVAMKTLSNYANHLAETPLDDVFRGQSWTHPEDRTSGAGGA